MFVFGRVWEYSLIDISGYEALESYFILGDLMHFLAINEMSPGNMSHF